MLHQSAPDSASLSNFRTRFSLCVKGFAHACSYLFFCLFQVTGVILLAVGIWGKVGLETYMSMVSKDSGNALYVLIGTGAVIIVFGLFGCVAACRGSPWMLKSVSR